MPSLTNFIFGRMTWFMKWIGFSEKRAIPKLYGMTLSAWFKKQPAPKEHPAKRVLSFQRRIPRTSTIPGVGIKTIMLLTKLGYEVIIPQHAISGRAYLSKGLLKKANRYPTTISVC